MATKAEWKARALTAEIDRDTLQAVCDGLLTERDELQARVDKAMADLTTSEQQRSALTALLAAGEAKIAGLNAEIAALQDKLRVCEAKLSPPAPQPPFGLPQVFAPIKASDWTNLLDDFPAPSGLTVDPYGEHRAYVAPNQQVKSGHMEFHELDWPGGGLPVPSEGYYEWEQFIFGSSVIDGLGTSQFHGDNQSGFTGSIGITFVNGTPQYRLRIMDAGNPRPRPFGVLRPGEWQKIGMHVRWSKGSDGFVRCYLDDKLGCEFKGKTAADPAGKQMFRIGWYTSNRVGPYGLDLRARKIRVYGRQG
jgi:hypothetical protein